MRPGGSRNVADRQPTDTRYTVEGGGEFTLARRGRHGSDAGWRQTPSAAERALLAEDPTVSVGLCVDCLHLRLLRSGRSRFVRCWLAESAAEYRRYPALPVLECDGYQPWRQL
jgi:hypothetical protein